MAEAKNGAMDLMDELARLPQLVVRRWTLRHLQLPPCKGVLRVFLV